MISKIPLALHQLLILKCLLFYSASIVIEAPYLAFKLFRSRSFHRQKYFLLVFIPVKCSFSVLPDVCNPNLDEMFSPIHTEPL